MLSHTLTLLSIAFLLAHSVTAANPHIRYEECFDDMPCRDTGVLATFRNTEAKWLEGRFMFNEAKDDFNACAHACHKQNKCGAVGWQASPTPNTPGNCDYYRQRPDSMTRSEDPGRDIQVAFKASCWSADIFYEDEPWFEAEKTLNRCCNTCFL